MNVDVLVAEIGSTTTVVNAFSGIYEGNPEFLGQGQAPTSVDLGDVTIGLNRALDNLIENMGCESLDWNEMFAASSAAGGLKMTVHGLVYDMTVKAAREAALGAGAIIKHVTAGKIRRTDIMKIKEIAPNIILVAGGVDYGERETSLYNFEKIAENFSDKPIIYAGNIENREEVRLIAEEKGIKVYIIDNVYPKIDTLNVDEARKIIQQIFEENIIHASGMGKVREMVNARIMTTPGSVMEAAKLFESGYGDVLVFDVGGATTDVHSVTGGSKELLNCVINPEPYAKRTVEGDLGIYANLENLVEKIGYEEIKKEFKDVDELVKNKKPIPKSAREVEFIERLALGAVNIALERHAGNIKQILGVSGKKTLVEGKDLTNIKYVIGTGGAFAKLPNSESILRRALVIKNPNKLYPSESPKLICDKAYLMASIGVLSLKYKHSAEKILENIFDCQKI